MCTRWQRTCVGSEGGGIGSWLRALQEATLGILGVVRPLLVKIGGVCDGTRSARVLSLEWEAQVHLTRCTTNGVLVIGEGFIPVVILVTYLPTR